MSVEMRDTMHDLAQERGRRGDISTRRRWNEGRRATGSGSQIRGINMYKGGGPHDREDNGLSTGEISKWLCRNCARAGRVVRRPLRQRPISFGCRRGACLETAPRILQRGP